MKVDGVAHEGGVVDEVEARPVLWYVALEKQLLSQLYTHARLKHFGVPQAVDHDDYIVVKLTERLAADVEGLLENTNSDESDEMMRKKREEQAKPFSISAELLMFVMPIHLHAVYHPFFLIRSATV